MSSLNKSPFLKLMEPRLDNISKELEITKTKDANLVNLAKDQLFVSWIKKESKNEASESLLKLSPIS